MFKLHATFRALAAAGGIGAIALAGVPALASTSSGARALTGPEVIAGTVYGKAAIASNTIIPLRLTGVVAARSRVNLGGSGAHRGGTKTLVTSAGKLTVMISAKPQSTQSVNPRTCRETYANYIPLTVVGSKSTGAFAGASGPGAVRIFFAAVAPRFKSGPKKGQCNPNGRPAAKGAVGSFLGSLVLTTK